MKSAQQPYSSTQISLRAALRELLRNWRADLSPEWQQVLGGAEPAFDNVDESLTLHPWEPIFPSRRHFSLPGEPPGAHLFRAFDDVTPDQVRCVIVGQDPYPSLGFSTGRSFEAGGYDDWGELEKMFSCSVRSLIQFVYAFRSGDQRHTRGTKAWTGVLQAIRESASGFPSPSGLIEHWVEQGVLLLNASLTLSRFSVQGDPHQLRGHLLLWRPFIARLIRHFAALPSQPVVFLLFGDAAREAAVAGGMATDARIDTHPAVISMPHPAAGDKFLRLPNPFALCNEKLLEKGAEPIQW